MTLWRRLTLLVLPFLGYVLIRAVGRTLRLRTVGAEQVESLWTAGQNVIIAFWHGRQVMMPLAYSRRRITKAARIEILVSRHRDGELIARVLRRFDFGTVRGSTTRGGGRALLEMVRQGRAGADLAVTPDGPRGPRCLAQPGIIELAKLTGLPIVPLTFAASKKNCSRVGIVLKCHGLSVVPAFFGARRCGYREISTGHRSKRRAWRCKRP
jgi:lysophospholipid acyltransferase (LPLAT)-like uncharacterized protein